MLRLMRKRGEAARTRLAAFRSRVAPRRASRPGPPQRRRPGCVETDRRRRGRQAAVLRAARDHVPDSLASRTPELPLSTLRAEEDELVVGVELGAPAFLIVG